MAYRLVRTLVYKHGVGITTRRDETTATKTMAAATMAAMAKAADHSTAVIGRAGPVGGERVSPFGD